MAASLLLEKAYTKSLVYVLLSNIYASVGFEDETNLDNEKGSDFIAMVIALRISDTLSLILCQEPNYTSSHSSNRPHSIFITWLYVVARTSIWMYKNCDLSIVMHNFLVLAYTIFIG
jgi:hypothetical protein